MQKNSYLRERHHSYSRCALRFQIGACSDKRTTGGNSIQGTEFQKQTCVCSDVCLQMMTFCKLLSACLNFTSAKNRNKIGVKSCFEQGWSEQILQRVKGPISDSALFPFLEKTISPTMTPPSPVFEECLRGDLWQIKFLYCSVAFNNFVRKSSLWNILFKIPIALSPVFQSLSNFPKICVLTGMAVPRCVFWYVFWVRSGWWSIWCSPPRHS